jgi:hypothetical protein
VKIQKRDVKSLLNGIVAASKLPDRYERDDVESLQESESEKLEKYNEDLEKLNEKHAKKNENGKIAANENGIILDENNVYEYNQELKKLRKKYKKELDENTAFLKEELEVKLHLVENKYFPSLPGGIGDYLLPMRKDPVDEEADDKKLETEKKKPDVKNKK